jgi:hypothetical protein
MTNRLMQSTWGWVEPTHSLRDGLLNQLSDADLAFTAGGSNMTFGALFREFGEIEHAYVESFKTLKQDFEYRHPDPAVATSVERLKAWFAQLDADMKTAVEGFSDADIDGKTIARGSGWAAPIEMQLEIYVQALLIFLGKASIFARALNKPLAQDYIEWIG